MMRHFVLFAEIFALLLGAFSLTACVEETERKEVVSFRSYAGEIELLNSCGIAGAASEMKNFLRKNGFDVVGFGNDILQNYEETILAIHTLDWEGAKPLAERLGIKNVLYVKNARAYVDATIYLGKDFKKLIQRDSL